ncbi:MAG TPA: peptide chain release factor N(5)-glutamine methyltransferase [Tepidisphaeraceae bacterium]|jgi:release factor glutamine methyltransferase|nr:peptide chain release factor N(5)-glutamine methyltransferase [Tepidisphaeraceae bacterium]
MAGETWTVRRLLEWTTPFFTRKEVDSPRLSAELLLAHILKVPRIKLYTDYERILSEPDLARYRALVQRAAEHEPIAYLTGVAHFFNLEFEVNKDVLIPRSDTETLVENVLQLVRNQPGLEAPRILDLCTGSGCVAIALARRLKHATVIATDLSPAAVAVAKRNAERLGVADRVFLEEGDLFAALEGKVDAQPFALIVANPPYIATGQMTSLPRNVREYEPLSALDGGLDGLVVHRKILAGAAERLISGGRLFLEIAFDQGPQAMEMIRQFPAFDEPRILKDFGGRDRVLTARRS